MTHGKTPTPNVTQAYQTIEAQMTLATSKQPTSTITPVSITPTHSLSTIQPVATLLPPTVKPRVSPTPNCDLATAGNPIDTTIPDGTVMGPNTTFTKTWRLVNIGTCTWTGSYAVVWFSGEIMGANQVNSLNVNVAPGGTIDVSVDMTAPKEPGTYIGYWKLRNPSGRAFGIGPSSDSPFWVKIEVSTQAASTSTPTVQVQATPAVLATGGISLLPDEAVDLSSLKKNQGSTDDFSYLVNTDATKHTLNPLQTAVISNPLSSIPTYSFCQSAALSSTPQALDNLAFSTYFCFKNHNNQTGWIRFLSLNSDGVMFEALTWSSQ
jgi:hypothetical protein